MLMGMVAEMIAKLENEFLEADPAEKELFVKNSLSLLQAIIAEAKK